MTDPIIWLLTGVVVILGVGVFIGVVMRDRQTADEQTRLAELERQLQAEWAALERTQRINEASWEARTALRDEAMQRRTIENVFHYRRRDDE